MSTNSDMVTFGPQNLSFDTQNLRWVATIMDSIPLDTPCACRLPVPGSRLVDYAGGGFLALLLPPSRISCVN